MSTELGRTSIVKAVRAIELNALIKLAAPTVLDNPPDSKDELVLQMQDNLLRMLKIQDSYVGGKIDPNARTLRHYLAVHRSTRLRNQAARELRALKYDTEAREEAQKERTRERNRIKRECDRRERVERARATGRLIQEAEHKAAQLFVLVCAHLGQDPKDVKQSGGTRETCMARAVFMCVVRDTNYCGRVMAYDYLATVMSMGNVHTTARWHHNQGQAKPEVLRHVRELCDQLGIAAPAYAVAAKEGSAS